jgi:hypothetical protein
MRTFIFFSATLLSGLGLVWSFLLPLIAISEVPRSEYSYLSGVLHLISTICAWLAYGWLGMGWIGGHKYGIVWASGATAAGLFGLSAGGTILPDLKLTLSVMASSAVFVAPAILMAIWLVQFHSFQNLKVLSRPNPSFERTASPPLN